MAYDFVAASSQRIEANSSFAALSFPFTLSCWARPDLTGTLRTLFSMPRATFASNIALKQSAGNLWQAVHVYGGTTGASSSSSSLSTGTWVHLVGVFNSNTSRTLYVDGSAQTADTTTVTTGTFKLPTLGYLQSPVGTFSQPYDGKLAECAVWSVALTDPEILSLARGFRPTLVRPQSLVYYAPLAGSANDLKDNVAPTLTNTPTADPLHPRRYG